MITRFSREELFSELRKVRLRGHQQFEVYANVDLQIESVDPNTLVPTQRYVLRPNVEAIRAARVRLLDDGVDTLALDGYVVFERDGEAIPAIPAIIEYWGGVPVINDGMHRIWLARELGTTINVVKVSGVHADYPYYAKPLAGGWGDVRLLDELPDGFVKKEYVDPTNYKALFRQFNDVFVGVQKERKSSNPEWIVA